MTPQVTAPIHRRDTGERIRLIQLGANKRLDARGEDRFKCPVDGQNGPKTARAVHRALYCLGITGSRLANAKKGIYSEEAQRLIFRPERRNKDMLSRARKRMTAIRKQREKEAKSKGGPSNLTESQRAEARNIAVAAAKLGLAHAPAIHYTQGGSRWQGISDTRYARQGQYPNYCDCSSFATWCLWNALHVRFGVGDVVNGANWQAGFTGTQLTHGVSVSLSAMKPGDLVLYGRGYPGSHVAIYIGGGRVISHGSEGGPYNLPYNYRSDIIGARRYI